MCPQGASGWVCSCYTGPENDRLEDSSRPDCLKKPQQNQQKNLKKLRKLRANWPKTCSNSPKIHPNFSKNHAKLRRKLALNSPKFPHNFHKVARNLLTHDTHPQARSLVPSLLDGGRRVLCSFLAAVASPMDCRSS